VTVRHSSSRNGISAGNPLANLVVIIAGALLIGVSVLVGFVAFFGLAAIVLVAAAIIGIRGWWQNRRPGARSRAPHGRDRPQVIEGEFQVLRKDSDRK
jgi:predicted lipid-binding transport protein (Tim44 family)